MARQKKSRKVGKIGVSKTPSNVRKPTEKRIRKPLGKPAGSRNSEKLSSTKQEVNQVNKDPRHGSKKPVSLVVDTKPQKTEKSKPSYFSPAQELAAIEKDQRLATLLDKVDKGMTLAKDEQQYLDQTLNRHKELCEMLGISEENEQTAKDEPQTDDLYAQFDAIDINDFKD